MRPNVPMRSAFLQFLVMHCTIDYLSMTRLIFGHLILASPPDTVFCPHKTYALPLIACLYITYILPAL